MRISLDFDVNDLKDMQFSGLLALLDVVPAEEAADQAPPAPAPAPEVPTPPADTTELDSAGVAWDESLHASSKAKNKDGTWRKRRGVEEAPDAPLAPPAPPAAAPAPPTPPVAETNHISHPDLMKLVTSAMTQGKDAQAIVTSLGFQWPPMDLFADAMGPQRDMVAEALRA